LKNLGQYFFIIIFTSLIGTVFWIEFHKKNLSSKNDKGIRTLYFWQYWTGQEKKPLEDLVLKFNSENHGFKVKMLTISLPRKKILMSIVGKLAPDLVHLDGDMVTDFALRKALLPLDDFWIKNPEVKKQDFIPIYLEMLGGYALPLMPTCEAMHVNLRRLNELTGSSEPPQKLEDLVKIFDASLAGARLSWLPSWPPWIGRFIVVPFGGSWGKLDEKANWIITAKDPKNIEAWDWVQKNFISKIPQEKLASFTEGLQAYQSPDNPFYSEKVIIENNGVWEINLAKKFAPQIELAAYPFPDNGFPLPTLVTVDALAIPEGAQNPDLAEKFMAWLLKAENLEYLALEQAKFTPLIKSSPRFLSNHPNPYIKTFIDLAKSPNAQYFPTIKEVQRYKREIKNSYDKLLRMEGSAEEILNELEEKMTRS
jgi:multiple sugar transport system substrate-binding protein